MEEHKKTFIHNMSEQMDAMNINQIELANAIGVSKSVISSWMTGKRFPKMNSIQQLADYFGIEKSDLLDSKNADEPTAEPKYTYLPVGISAGALEEVDAVTSLEKIRVPDIFLGRYARNKNVAFMHVNGESMNRLIPNGSLMAVLTNVEIGSLKNGDVVVVSDGDREYTVKHFYNDKINRQFILQPDSTEKCFMPMVYSYENAKDFKVIGKVIVYSIALE